MAQRQSGMRLTALCAAADTGTIQWSPADSDAILDRVVHTAYSLQLKGESQRKLCSPLTMPST